MNKQKINEQTKFISKNPLVKFVNARFLRTIYALIKLAEEEKILDCGCGEGVVLKFLSDKDPALSLAGFDINKKSLKIARDVNPKANLKNGSIYQIPYAVDSFPLVLCTEVLEHLAEPYKALKELSRITPRYVIVSVPCEPFFRLSNMLRFKYWRRLGSTPGHLNHWSPTSFKNILSADFEIRQETYPFPWMMFLVSVKK